MRTICKARLQLDRASEAPWNVQLWHSFDGGKSFVYAGYGKYFTNDSAGQQAMREYLDAHCSPIREFPIITSKIQRDFESLSLDDALELPASPGDDEEPHQGYLPMICGYYGRACFRLNDEEGARSALCSGCPLAEYAHGVEMMNYAKGGDENAVT